MDLEKQSYVLQGEEKLSVTISIGATRVKDDDTLDTLLKRADALMYDSKAAGRNRLTFG